MVSPEDLECLKKIAQMGGLSCPVFLKSQGLGTELGISPQTVSRRLKSLEQQHFIIRNLLAEGQNISLTEAGEGALRKEYCEYYKLFGGKAKKFTLSGTVESGLGEGAYYMSLRPYALQFEQILGFIPYPGTLNIRLTPTGVMSRKKTALANWHVIKGFVSEGRTFGDVRCLPCMIQDIPCGIIVPGRSHYPDELVEVVAPTAMRNTLGLQDGDEVTIEVMI